MLKIIKIVQFVLSVIYIFYVCAWIFPVWRFLKGEKREGHTAWSQAVVQSMRVQFSKIKGSYPIQKTKKTMFLINHRTQGDFFIHDIVTEHTANFLSRMMVGIVFPIVWFVTSQWTNSVWYFRRGGNDLKTFFVWCDKMYAQAYRQNLVVYPEGHRMGKTQKAGSLKKGMIQYAYLRNQDIQIIISFGGEDVFNERLYLACYGPKNVISFVDKVIEPKNFENFELFYEHIQIRFAELFEQAYNIYQTSDNTKLQ